MLPLVTVLAVTVLAVTELQARKERALQQPSCVCVRVCACVCVRVRVRVCVCVCVNIVSLKVFRVDGCLWFVEVWERANRDNLGWGSGTTLHCTFHSLHVSDIVQTAADMGSRSTAAAELAAVPCFKLVFTTFVGCCGPFATA